MPSIVINTCYGGFGLSQEAERLLCQLKHVPIPDSPASLYCYVNNVDRTDPALIQVVKQLGEEANGKYAKLKIVEFPDHIKKEWLVIDVYDGVESVSVDYGRAAILCMERALEEQTPVETTWNQLLEICKLYQSKDGESRTFYQRDKYGYHDSSW